MHLTTAQWEALRSVDWGTRHFGALVSGRQTRASTLRVLETKGLVVDAGMVAVCDGDGFLVRPERYRRGWKITAAGKKALEEDKEE